MEFINDTCWCMLLDPLVIQPKRPNHEYGKYALWPRLTQRSFDLKHGSQVLLKTGVRQ
jgi:hypothetical protein